jgi:transglutaminase-like putative cysteine protease
VSRPADAPARRRSGDPAGLRRTAEALLASALGVVPLLTLISDRGWLVDVWLTMLVVTAPPLLLRRNRPPSAAHDWIGIVLMIPWLTVRFVPQHAVLGLLPLGGAWHDVATLMGDLHQTIQNEAAPVHSTVGMRLALCALLGLMAALIDLVAVVGRHGALAGVPLLVVFSVAGAVPRRPVPWELFLVAGAAFLLLLSVDSLDDMSRWGHLVRRSGTSRAAQTLNPSGRRIAVIALALAVLLPLFVPSNSRNALANLFHNASGRGPGGFGAADSGSISPFAALRGQLVRPGEQALFTVQVTDRSGSAGLQPFYLRENVLSDYVGDGWAVGSHGPSHSVDAGLDVVPRPGFNTYDAFDADITISGLTSNAPVFALPTEVSGINGGTDWMPLDELFTGTKVSRGDVIHETVAQPHPTVRQLRAAPPLDAGTGLEQYLRLPALPRYVNSLVRRLTSGASGPYDRARAISDYFTDPKSGFAYTLATPSGDSGNALVDFLKAKSGYCQQYAAAMAVMLRRAGVPARVVLGYTHGVPDAGGSFKVTTSDAHAWVEAYFTGIGWVPFDPTPIAALPGAATNGLPWAPHASSNSQDNNGIPNKKSLSNQAGPTSSAASSSAKAAHEHSRKRSGVSSTVPLVALGGLALIGLLLLLPFALRRVQRARRLRRAAAGDGEALWDELSATATDLGYVWSSARTPRQVADQLSGPTGGAAGSLRTLTTVVERSRYAPTPVDGADVDADFARVESALRRRLPAGARLRAALLPPSLLRQVRPGWAHLPGRRH